MTTFQNDTLILFGTQTGTAEDLAEQLSETLVNHGIVNRLENMFDVDMEMVTTFKKLIIIVSTWGDGEPPDDGEALHLEFSEYSENTFAGIDFAVFGLGDTGYEQFCQCGIDFDTFLEKGGGKRLLNRVDGDMDFDEEFETWSRSITKLLTPEKQQALA